jgi:class 3 adenylate cyclase
MLEPLVSRHQGRLFKVTGDGVVIEFACPLGLAGNQSLL